MLLSPEEKRGWREDFYLLEGLQQCSLSDLMWGVDESRGEGTCALQVTSPAPHFANVLDLVINTLNLKNVDTNKETSFSTMITIELLLLILNTIKTKGILWSCVILHLSHHYGEATVIAKSPFVHHLHSLDRHYQPI